MDSVAVTVPLRPPTKKMKKRKELDALAAPHAITRRNSGKRSSQELLTDSSDDRSEYWSVSTRGGRKCRGIRRGRTCQGFLRACSAFLACASILATGILIWLFINVHERLIAVRTELNQVVAGNADVPNTLQQYHSLSKDLQNNQTIILANITEIKLQIANFTIQLTSIQRGLHEVQETIRAAPELVNIPNKLKDLSTEVSTLGSKITDILSTTNESRKETHRSIESWQSNMSNNITRIEQKLSDLSNISQKPQAVFYNESKAQNEFFNSTIAELRDNLTTVNNTLTRNLQSTKNNEDNLIEYKKRLVQFDETTHNLTARVGSLDGECAKITAQEEIRVIVDKLNAEMNSLKYNDTKLKSQIEALENSYNTMKISISGLQNYQKSYNTTFQNNEDITAILSEGGKTVSKDTELITESSNGPIKESGGEITKKDTKIDTAESMKGLEIDPTT